MKFSTYELVLIGIFSALFCIIGPINIPIGPIPLSLMSFILFLSIYLIGYKLATFSYLIYILIGFMGLPVFTGFSGGFSKLISPTGGYIVGFIFTSIISGYLLAKTNNRLLSILYMLIGTAILYFFGTIWFSVISENRYIIEILKICVTPFILVDLVKILIVAFIAPMLQKKLKIALKN